jgi:curved DNA-binding protein CbpA
MKRKLSHYEVLRVDEAASFDEIKAAWHAIAKKTHPDRNPGNEKALRVFKRCSEAWDVLSDPELRKAYDATLHPDSKKPSCSSCGSPVANSDQKLCPRCNILQRMPSKASTLESDFPPDSAEAAFASASRRVREYEQPLPPRMNSMSLLEGLMAESAIRHAFNGEEGGNGKSIVEVDQDGKKIHIEIDADSLRALHGNLKTSWRIFRLVRDLFR